MPTKDLTGHKIEAEIFSTGTWNGETFIVKDLEEIAANFKRLKHQIKPPLKFGHDEEQNLLGQQDGDPALGWVEKVRVMGDKLVATFAGVPDVVYQAIKAKRYRRVSAEIYFNVRRNGKKLGKTLKAVALLGADLPAVTNLEDLTAFLTDRHLNNLQVGDSRIYNLTFIGAEIRPFNEERQEMSESENRQGLETELAELRAYKAEQEGLLELEMTQRKSQAYNSAREDVLAFSRELVSAGRVSPHFQVRLLKEIDAQKRTFSAEEGLKISFGWLKDFINSSPPLLPKGEVGYSNTGQIPSENDEDNPSLALSRLATAKMAEMKLTYGQAVEYVLKTNPALANAYRDYTLNPIQGG